MKAQGILTVALAMGQFLTRMLLARERECEHETSRHIVSKASRKKSRENDAPRTKRGDTPTMPEVVIRSAEEAVQTQSSQPATLHPGPVLALLIMLRNRRPRSHRTHGREPGLPPGCLLAVRYASR